MAGRAKEDGASVIVFDAALSPGQQRNWEELAGLAVIDRQGVILEVRRSCAHARGGASGGAGPIGVFAPAPDASVDPPFQAARKGFDGR